MRVVMMMKMIRVIMMTMTMLLLPVRVGWVACQASALLPKVSLKSL